MEMIALYVKLMVMWQFLVIFKGKVERFQRFVASLMFR